MRIFTSPATASNSGVVSRSTMMASSSARRAMERVRSMGSLALTGTNAAPLHSAPSVPTYATSDRAAKTPTRVAGRPSARTIAAASTRALSARAAYEIIWPRTTTAGAFGYRSALASTPVRSERPASISGHERGNWSRMRFDELADGAIPGQRDDLVIGDRQPVRLLERQNQRHVIDGVPLRDGVELQRIVQHRGIDPQGIRDDARETRGHG